MKKKKESLIIIKEQKYKIKGVSMSEQISKGRWREIKGKIREQWGNISEDELEKTKGNIDQIAGKIQRNCGESIEKVQKKLNSLLDHANKSIS